MNMFCSNNIYLAMSLYDVNIVILLTLHLGMYLELSYSTVVVSSAELEAAISQVERQAQYKW